jgi:hypothetical protein
MLIVPGPVDASGTFTSITSCKLKCLLAEHLLSSKKKQIKGILLISPLHAVNYTYFIGCIKVLLDISAYIDQKILFCIVMDFFYFLNLTNFL